MVGLIYNCLLYSLKRQMHPVFYFYIVLGLIMKDLSVHVILKNICIKLYL